MNLFGMEICYISPNITNDVLTDVENVSKYLEEANKIMSELQKQNDINLEILKNNNFELVKYHAPNTPDVGVLTKISNNLDNITDAFGKIAYYMNNPYMLFKLIVTSIATSAFYICMLVCLWSVIIYVASGSVKAKQTAYISFFVFLAIKIISILV